MIYITERLSMTDDIDYRTHDRFDLMVSVLSITLT